MLKKLLNYKCHLRFLFNPIYRSLSDNMGDYPRITELKRDIPIVVSITSYDERFKDLELSLYSVFNQTTLPDRVVLWLSDEYSLNELPYSVTKYIKYGLEIRFVKDIGSYTKIIYALKEFSNCIIVTADDDIFYQRTWLEKLYHSYLSASQDIHVHRAHRVLCSDNTVYPYEKWEKHVDEESARYDNFLTGCGGVLYPPKCFENEVFRSDIFLKYAPYADDVWLWFMAILSGRKIRVVKNHINTLTCTNIFRQLGFTHSRFLYKRNKQGGNDEQIRNLLIFYKKNIITALKN